MSLARSRRKNTTVRVLKGKRLANDIRGLARRLGVDLSKADDEETERILRKTSSLSRAVVKMRQRPLA
jgi:hypothetical protein